MTIPEFAPGTIFVGDFRVLRTLGRGHQGILYQVEQLSAGVERALRVLQADPTGDGQLAERFLEQARLSARIPSDNVVQTVASGVDATSGCPWLAMELLHGDDLARTLEKTGAWSFSQLTPVFGQLCQALRAAHELGLTHRDLRPGNLFLSAPRQDGESPLVKVLGFGVGAVARDSQASLGALPQAPLWLAPEQVLANGRIGPPADLWALGLLVWNVLTGRSFWLAAQGKGPANPADVIKEVVLDPLPKGTERARQLGLGLRLPQGFDDWFARCVSRDPKARFSGIAEAQAAFERLTEPQHEGSAASVQTFQSLEGVVRPEHPTAPEVTPPGLLGDSNHRGRTLLGRYRIIDQLGQGAMGSVWSAEHLTLRSRVAVKLMDPSIASTPEGIARFEREAQAAASLRSANVVQVLDYGVQDSTPFLVMEHLDGENLAALLEREIRLPADRTFHILSQVARAIARAHAASIIHRDIKPHNIFIVKEGDEEVAKVLDFGVAKTDSKAFTGIRTGTGVTVGTMYYMSPEQAEGQKSLDHRADLWALAVIACECLTGERPFRGETYGELLLNICVRPVPVPSSLGPVPDGFDEWFGRATHRDINQRFTGAQEMMAAFRELVGGSPQELPKTSPPTQEALDNPKIPFNRKAKAPAILLTALFFGALGWVMVTVARPTPSAPPVPLTASLTLSAASQPGPSPEVQPHSAAPATEKGSTPEVAPATPSSSPAPAAPATSAAATRKGSESPPQLRAHPAGKPLVPAPVLSLPAAAPSVPSPSPASVTATSEGNSQSCYFDSRSQKVMLWSTGHRPPGSTPFACQQNPFTGQFQRLKR